ncbi:MAG: FG-GAP-like repeat-containing protein [Polyangiales bacterium]
MTVALLALAGCGDLPPGSDRAPPSTLRRVWPTTGAVVRSPRPRVRWRGGAEGERARVVFCADRGCARVIETVESTTGAAQPTRSLPGGVVFWSVHERPPDGGARPYATTGWFLVPRGARDVPARASQSTWWSAHTDADGDGRWDYVDIDGQWFARGATERRAVLSELGLLPAYNAGDLDGDGFADFIGGDPLREERRGAMLAYRGPLSNGGNAAWASVYPSQQRDAHCAAVPSVTGDFNGDGLRDVAASCPSAEGGRGVVSVHLSTVESLTEAAQRVFVADGRPVDNRETEGLRALLSEDLDGDGFDDLVVGAQSWQCVRETVTNMCIGRGYFALHRGGAEGVRATRWVRADGDGRLVATADLDGEGLRRVVLWDENTFHVQALSGDGLMEVERFAFANHRVFEWNNLFVADFDGDGRDELLVVHERTDGREPARGVYLRRDVVASWSAIPLDEIPAPWSDIGHGGIADVNGDGYPDLAVGTYSSGYVYIYHGNGTGLATTPARTLSGSNYFGITLAGAGDVNGDGYSDLIVGSSNSSTTTTARAWVYYGSATGLPSTASVTISTADGYGAYVVAGLGDVNGDGYSDVVTGSYSNRARVYYGSAAGLVTTTNTLLTGSASYFGYTLSSLGDANGDGYADLLVGSYTTSTSYNRVNVFNGGASAIATTPSFGTVGTDSYFGYYVTGAGDVNGDGFADMVAAGSSATRATLYYGAATGYSASRTATLTASGVSTYFGRGMANIGDVNGDGYADVAVGDYYNNRVYVFLGGASGVTATPQTLTSTQGYFGYAVAPIN